VCATITKLFYLAAVGRDDGRATLKRKRERGGKKNNKIENKEKTS
jgi:hypothetical protein